MISIYDIWIGLQNSPLSMKAYLLFLLVLVLFLLYFGILWDAEDK